MNDTFPRPENVKPKGLRILVLPDPAMTKTVSGLELPDEGVERPQVGTVIKIGNKVTEYKEGDRVLYGKFSGMKIAFENEDSEVGFKDYYLMYESEIFAEI